MAPEPPFANPHLQYTFSGSLPGGEEWSTGFRTVTAMTIPGDLQGFADQASTAFKIMWESVNSLQALNPPAVTFAKTVVRQVNAAGVTLFTAETDLGTADPGQASSCNCPNQTALVVTTRTAVAGRSARGRMYLPLLTGFLVKETGRLVADDQNGIITAMGIFLGKFILITSQSGVASEGPFPAAIQSRVAGKGENQITHIQIGDCLDTQRRRRDKLVENYVNRAVTSTGP